MCFPVRPDTADLGNNLVVHQSLVLGVGKKKQHYDEKNN